MTQTKDYKERAIQLRMSQELLGSKTEVYTNFGRIDILTNTEIIELKNWKLWKFGMGQLLAYAPYFPTRTLRLHCFGEVRNETRHSIIRLFERLPVKIKLTWED